MKPNRINNLSQVQSKALMMKVASYTSNKREITVEGVIGSRNYILVTCLSVLRNIVPTWLSEITKEIYMES
jgi:hypothetical protein